MILSAGLQSSLPFNVEIGLTSSPHPYLVMETTAAQSIDELIDFESKGEGVLRLHWLKDLESEEAAATKASLRWHVADPCLYTDG